MLEPIIIEIHHNIANEPFMSKIEPEDLWQDAQEISIAGIKSFILSPENMLINFCIHMSDEFFVGKIKILVDIAETIKYYYAKLDWDFIIEKSNEYKIGTFVYYSLYLADKIMGVKIPSYVFKHLKLAPKLKGIEKTILREIIKRSIIKDNDSLIPPAFITSLCEEFFYTPKIYSRLTNLLVLLSGSAFKLTMRTARNCI